MIGAIIQARMTSTRFPGKMAVDLNNYSLIEWVIRRVMLSKRIDKIILAIPKSKKSDFFFDLKSKYPIEIFTGDEFNLCKRFNGVISKYKLNNIVRICGDNPFIMSREIDRLVNIHINSNYDYSFNHIPALNNNYIDGVGAEIFSSRTFKFLYNQKLNNSQKEHVTKYIWDNLSSFRIKAIKAPKDLSYPNLKLDIDNLDDYNLIKKFIKIYKEHFVFDNPEEFSVPKLIQVIKQIEN